MSFFRTLACAALVVASGTLRAQPFGTWMSYSATLHVGESRVSGLGEAQLRSHRVLSDFDQALGRLGVVYAFPGGPRLMQGVVLSRTADRGPSEAGRTEFRLHQDAVFGARVGAVHLSQRLRVEERWIGDTPLQLRGRAQLAGVVPVTGGAPRRGSLDASVSVEPFWRGPGRGEQPVFERVRVYAGLGLHLSRALIVRGGLVLQQSTDESDMQALVSVHHGLSLGTDGQGQ
ncbi:MAG TPA: DUF2490 domain-containing protein [Rubricoccaceae bacterium]|jgi:hypothetical protein